MANAEITRKRRGAYQGSNGDRQAGSAATGAAENSDATGEGLDGGQSVTSDKSEAGSAATGAAPILWDSLNAHLLEIEQRHPERRIVRVFAPCEEVPDMFIGAFGNAPVELSEAGKPPAVQWQDGEIVIL